MSSQKEMILDALWEANVPLTAREIEAHIKQKKWALTKVNVHRLTNELIEAGLLKVTDQVRSGKVFARKLEPTLSKADYTEEKYTNSYLDADLVNQMMLGLAKASADLDPDQEGIEKLEETIRQMAEKEEK